MKTGIAVAAVLVAVGTFGLTKTMALGPVGVWCACGFAAGTVLYVGCGILLLRGGNGPR